MGMPISASRAFSPMVSQPVSPRPPAAQTASSAGAAELAKQVAQQQTLQLSKEGPLGTLLNTKA